jgi:hypothetical protein
MYMYKYIHEHVCMYIQIRKYQQGGEGEGAALLGLFCTELGLFCTELGLFCAYQQGGEGEGAALLALAFFSVVIADRRPAAVLVNTSTC